MSRLRMRCSTSRSLGRSGSSTLRKVADRQADRRPQKRTMLSLLGILRSLARAASVSQTADMQQTWGRATRHARSSPAGSTGTWVELTVAGCDADADLVTRVVATAPSRESGRESMGSSSRAGPLLQSARHLGLESASRYDCARHSSSQAAGRGRRASAARRPGPRAEGVP